MFEKRILFNKLCACPIVNIVCLEIEIDHKVTYINWLWLKHCALRRLNFTMVEDLV